MNSLPISYRYIPKSLSSRDFFNPSRINTIPTTKKINEFMKTTNIKKLNTNGTSPIIIYKKTPRVNYKSEIQFGLLRSGEYITDGGLKKKKEKFNTENPIKETKSSNKMLTSTNSKTIIKNKCSQSMKSIRKKNENNNNNSNNKNQIKRNNYFSPPPKSTSSNNKTLRKSIKKTKESSKKEKKEKKNEKKEDNEVFEEEKRKYMNQLIENAVANFIREIQLEKKPTIEEEMNEKKQKVLEDNGIEIHIDTLENTQDEERKENEYNDLEEDKIEEENNLNSQSSNNNIGKINKNFSPRLNNYFLEKEFEKKIYKPKVDQFEFLRKIKEERIKNYSKRSSNSKSNDINNKKKNNVQTENSFRNLYSNDKNKKEINSYLDSNEEIENDLLYTHHKNVRSEEELRDFKKKKKEKLRKKTEEEDLEKNKKLFIIFKNLFSLSTNEKNKLKSKENKKLKRKRIKNEYYIGNESKNTSTIIEPNDYYMNVLESQQLLVNGGLYKIDLDNINQSVNKETIKKITEKENSRMNTEGSNNSNRSTFNKLNEQVNQTISKSQNLINQVKNNNLYSNNKPINVNNQNLEIESENNTKEKNLPSLSHTYTGNSNQKKIVEIEPRAVLNLVDIIRLIIQRKVFYNLFEIYINEIISQRFTVGITFFIAIIKHYPFRKIEEYSNYKTYHLAFLQLFKPFLKRMFIYFLNCFFTRKKIEYFTEILSRLFKFKALEKIFDYSQEIENNEEALAFKLILTRIMKLTMKPKLKEAFNLFCENCNNTQYKKKRDYSSKTPFENNNIIREETNSSQSSFKNNSNLNRMKYNPLKMNSFLYESLESSNKSSYTVEPNSVDNDRLHQLQLMLMEKRDALGFEDYPYNDDYSEKKIETSSNKSAKSLQEICKMKPGLNISRSLSELSKDNSIKKSISNKSLQKSLNNSKENVNNSSLDDNKKEKTLKEKIEEIKYNLKPENIDKNNFEDIKEIPSILTKEEKMRIENKEEEKKEEENKEKNSLNESSNIKDISNKEDNNFEFPENYKDIKDNSINLGNYINNENSESEEIKNSPKKEEEEKKELNSIKLETNIPEEIKEIPNKQLNSINDNDISAEKDGNQIDWEYSISNSKSLPNDNKKQIKENIIENKKENKKNSLNNDDDYGGFEDISDVEKEEENIISIIKNETKTNDKSRNNLSNSPQKKEEEEKDKTSKKESNEKEYPKILNLKFENNEKEIDNITEEIINNILDSEIKSDKVKLIPKRKYKYDPFSNLQMSLSQSASLSNSKESPSKDSNTVIKENLGLSLSNLPLKDNSFQSLNDSLMSSYSAYSIFNKTMKDQKKENSFKLYYNKIAPKLIKLIRKEIKEKYNEIYENISTPMKNNGKGLMISLALQDADMLKDNYKRLNLKKEISNIINKEKILKEFEPINIKIRHEDNITSDNFYDNMLNNCLIDTAIELINKERLYNESGDPLPWSSRTHEIVFKYDKNNPKKLCDYVTKNLFYLLHNRIGLISENYDFLSGEQLNVERERRFLKMIHNELDENEYQWKNLEMEETQLKIEVTEMIMDQLYNEIIEILEHIQYCRRRPDLYQYKSIYACEEIPKLSFQVTTTENLESGDDDNDLMNI